MSTEGRRLLDHWDPPDGAGGALGCVATTFTFDADFFEQQCAGRFLALDTRPENELAFLIEREDKLAETPIAVVADRRLNPDSRSLRWDVLTALAPTGVMHAKLALLVWEHAVRVLVTSANLTERSYRATIEAAIGLDAVSGSDLPRAVVDVLLDEVRRVVRLAPGNEAAEGPKARALGTLRRAEDVLDRLGLPAAARRGAPRLKVTATGRGDDVLDQLLEVWSGPPPRHATVMSPFFDAGAGESRAASRLVELLAKRNSRVDVVVPVDQLDARSVARVPPALLAALPDRLQPRIFDVRQPDPEEPRWLHAKVVLLEGPRWVAALVGSSNFTRAGLGVGGGGNVEVGLALGAPADSDVAAALRLLVLPGDEVKGPVDFEPVEDPEEQEVPVPAAFVSALADPGPPLVLRLELDPGELPDWWEVATLDGTLLASSEQDGAGAATVERPVDDPPPFVVVVRWEDADGVRQQGKLPVNVTDPAALPPPAELLNLPVEALLRALGSTRPLHEGLAAEVERIARAEAAPASADGHLDPLSASRLRACSCSARRSSRTPSPGSASASVAPPRLSTPSAGGSAARSALRRSPRDCCGRPTSAGRLTARRPSCSRRSRSPLPTSTSTRPAAISTDSGTTPKRRCATRSMLWPSCAKDVPRNRPSRRTPTPPSTGPTDEVGAVLERIARRARRKPRGQPRGRRAPDGDPPPRSCGASSTCPARSSPTRSGWGRPSSRSPSPPP